MIRLEVLGSFASRAPSGAELGTLASQPKRAALLTYLALEANGRFVRRDSLLALFWPDADATRARSSLRQALYSIAQGLGTDPLRRRGAEEIGIDPNALWCDAVEFQALIAANRPADALALFQGDLLAGVFVPGASTELEQWLDAARERIRSHADR